MAVGSTPIILMETEARPQTLRIRSSSGQARLFVAMTLVALFVVWCSVPFFTYSVPPQDEGMLLVYPERILAGAIPSRDFRCSYGPANFYILAASFKALGASVNNERVVGLLYRVLLVTGVGALAGRRGVLIGLVGAGLSWPMTLALGLGAYSWFGAVACLVWSLWLATVPGLSRAFPQRCAALAAGLLAGMAVLFRPDLLVVTLLSGLPVFLTLDRSRKRLYGMGATFGIALFAAYLTAASPATVAGNLVNAILTSRNMRLTKSHATIEETRLLWLLCVATLSTFAVASFRAWQARGCPDSRPGLSVALLSVGVLQQVLGYPDVFHIMYGACVIIGLWPFGFAAAFSRDQGRLGIHSQAVVAFVVCTAILALTGRAILWPAGRSVKVALGLIHYDRFQVLHRGRKLPIATANEMRDMEALLNKVEAVTSPGDGLVVGPKDLRGTPFGSTVLYFMLPQLKPATYHLEIFPGTTVGPGPGTRFYDDLASGRVVILDCRWDNPQAAKDRTFGDATDPAKILSDHFAFEGQYGTFELYLRKKN